MDYEVLKNEITNNPKNIPGLGWSQSDIWIVDTLNTAGISSETTVREYVNTADIIVAIYSDKDEFITISQINLLRLNLLAPVGIVNPADIQAVMKEIFPVESFPNIRVALIALAIRPATRAEILFSEPATLIAVNKARRLHNG